MATETIPSRGCLSHRQAPPWSPMPSSPNLALPSTPQVFERSSVSSLPPTPRRQPIPTLLSPQDPGPPGCSAPGPAWKVTGCALSRLSFCLCPTASSLTCHANLLGLQSQLRCPAGLTLPSYAALGSVLLSRLAFSRPRHLALTFGWSFCWAEPRFCLVCGSVSIPMVS